MPVLSELEPKNVYRFFEEMCAIPHGSGHTKAISDYLAAFAAERGLKYRQDSSNNVIIWKGATPGYENAPGVIIQGHMDMVAEKDADCTKDMEKEGLDLFIEGDTVGARGTTLGSDDGIAVAMGLAILDADDIPHGPLECLFTVDEEIGMLGARALDPGDIRGRLLLNIDSEEDKVLTVSCAGSARAACIFPVRRAAFTGETMRLSITGLFGGHSGEEIHKGRANSNVLMGRALFELNKAASLRLISVCGGQKDNAIPREAEALFVTTAPKKTAEAAEALQTALRNEFRNADSNITVSVSAAKADGLPMDEESTRHVTAFLFCAPNAVQAMSPDVPGLVQTSINLGQVRTEGDEVVCRFMPRSSVNSQKEEVLERLEALAGVNGGRLEISSSYSAWEYRPDSPLRDVMIEAFREVYGEEPKVAALHAGLECGILSGKLPGLDSVSFGPDLTDIHTPRERLHIASAARVWKLTLETLRRLK